MAESIVIDRIWVRAPCRQCAQIGLVTALPPWANNPVPKPEEETEKKNKSPRRPFGFALVEHSSKPDPQKGRYC